ncbi:MAG: HAMP domain-containing protein [Acidimicrobiales bacterium]|nr:HAMP domain-containing protein [Acidimicrobiales bacterium]
MRLVPRRRREQVEGRGRRLTTRANLRFGLATLAGGAFEYLYLVRLNPPSASIDVGPPAVAAMIIGLVVLSAIDWQLNSRRLLRPVEAWLEEDRPATEREREAVLRLPWDMVSRSYLHWVVTAALFAVMMAVLGSTRLAVLRVSLALLVGGLITCALGYFLIERDLRPLTARALTGVPPGRARRLSLTVRLLLGWALGSALPVCGILLVLVGPRDVSGNFRVSVTFLCLVVLIAGGLLMLATAGSVAEPLTDLREALDEVGDGDLDVTVDVNDGGEIGELQAEFNHMVEGLRERRRLEDLFGRHVGVEVARYALSQQAGRSAQIKQASALFVDVIASTRLAVELPPVELLAMLNSLFDVTVRVVTGHGGWVNKFEGDGALCVFGAPGEQPDHADRALAAARELRAEVAALAGEWPRLDVGIGVSSGRVVAGNVGAEERYEYTVLGDPVNEAARLTDEAKRRPARVLAGGAAVAAASAAERRRWEPCGELALRGRDGPTECWAPVRP